MNIFFVYFNAMLAAQALGDKHVVKMPLEMAQLLCTSYRWLHGQRPAQRKRKKRKTEAPEPVTVPHDDELYKMTHYNHPMAIWVRSSLDNFKWTLSHGIALCVEWQWRYGHPATKEHGCMRIFKLMQDILDTEAQFASRFPKQGFTVPPQCMPEEYRVPGNTLSATQEAYRKYYVGAKKDIVAYNKRPIRQPEWFGT